MATPAVFARPDEFSLLSVSITAERSTAALGDAVELRLQVENRGESRLDAVSVSLYAGSRLIHAERMDLPVNAVSDLVTKWTPQATGTTWLTAKARPADPHLQRGRADAMAIAAIVVGHDSAHAQPTVPPTVTPADHVITRESTVGHARMAMLVAAPQAAAEGHWISLGPTVIASGLGATGRVHQICIHPETTTTVYAASGGVSGSGIWKTTDGAATWAPVTDGLGTPNVKALAVDPSNPSRLFAATTDGLIRTDNGADTWSTVAASNALAIGSSDEVLLVDPRRPTTVLLTGRDGVRRSEDSGATWSVVLPAGRPTDLVMEPSEPRRLYAAINNAANPANSGIYESPDGGATWRQLRGCPGGLLPVLSGAANIRLTISGSTIYASFKTDTAWTLYATTGSCNVGGQEERVWEARWRPTGSVGGQSIFRRLWKGIHADPRDARFLYAQGTDLWFSSDGGDSFERLSGPHADHQAFAFDPLNSSVVYTVSDGGVYRSNARGAAGTWTFVGRGMRNTEFYDLATPATEPQVAIGGTQDNGTVRYHTPATDWTQVRGGDGGTVAIDPTDEQVVYSMGQYADSIQRSGDGGDNWIAFSQSLPPTGDCFNLHFHIHPVDTGILLASCTSLWRRDQDSDWQAIFTPASGGVVRSAVDGRTDAYFAGTGVGEVYEGVGGQNFRLVLPADFGAGAVRDIVVDPEHRGVLFLAYAGSQQGRVRRAVGSTTSTYVVEDITANLPPSLTVNSLAVDRMSANTVFAGTNRGVYRGRLLGSASWSWDDYNLGMPYPDVRALDANSGTGVLRAGTYGRGAYEVTTGPPFGSILRAAGRVTFLRIQEVGSGWGSGANFLDVELVVRLDSQPEYAFGLQLRPGSQEYAALGAVDHLRRSMRRNSVIDIDYRRTGFRSGTIIRVTQKS